MSTEPSAAEAARDLDFIRDVVDRTDRRVDPHAFHYVHWGAIVLLWYPIANWLALRGEIGPMIAVGVGSVALGMLLSIVREIRLQKSPRLEGENTFLSNQMMLVTFASIGAGAVLSGVSPNFGFIEGPNIPTLWALVYANMAVMLGIIYRRAFLYAGIVIFAAAIIAIIVPAYNGFIVGPAMGLGMIVPGLQAERRVKELQAEPRAA